MASSESSENEVLNACCEYLSVRGYFFWRNNTVGIYDPIKKIHRKMPKWSMRGVSDIIVLLDGTAWFIEVKDKGVQSKWQKEFESNVKENGCQYHIVRSVDDLVELGF